MRISLPSVEQRDMADRLHQFGVAGFADRCDELCFRCAIQAPEPHLHQLVVLQREVDFPHHRLAQSRATDEDDRFEGVAAPAQVAFEFFTKWHRRIQDSEQALLL
jgi:hypothetical protein